MACLLNGLPVVLGLSLTGAITQFTKITVGRPRPGGKRSTNERLRFLEDKVAGESFLLSEVPLFRCRSFSAISVCKKIG